MFSRLAEAWREWRAPAPAAAPLREALGVTIDDDDDQWRRLSGDSGRDLSPLSQQRMRETALYLWERNLLADRLVEIPLDYILGEGVALTADDDDARAALERFWNDPINAMDLHLEELLRELSLYGEQVWPAFVHESTGHVRLGYLDPGLIETVVLDPDNARQPIGIVTVKDKRGNARRFRVIVNGDEEDVFTERTRAIRASFSDGQCFYFRIRALSNGRRGRSDLLAPADWLDGYDQFLFGEVDRINFLRSFVWDVTLKGATADEVTTRAKQIKAPSPGAVRVHNDAEEWAAVTPGLAAADTAEQARLLRNHVLGGRQIPEHWYGGGGDVNRSTGESMGEPTFKAFSRRQRFYGYLLVQVGRFVVRNALAAGATPLAWDDDRVAGVRVEWPELTARDTSRYAAALGQVAAAAVQLLDAGLITHDYALTLVASIAERLGVDTDVEALLDEARAEEATRAERDAFTVPPVPPVPGEGEGDPPPAPAADDGGGDGAA